jgi:peroxiredoxin
VLVEAGAIAPKFSLGGQQLPSPNSVLVFYRVTCPTCKLTLPYLHRLSVPAVGISQNDALDTASFEHRFEVKIPSVLDHENDGFPVSNAYGVHHVPTLFVIDDKGKVTKRIEGFDKEALEDLGVEFSESEKVPEFKPG